MNEKKHQQDKLLRLRQVLEIIPLSRAGWYVGVSDGRFPKPIKLGERTTCWRESEILALVENGIEGDAA